jgi:hypothetical protein
MMVNGHQFFNRFYDTVAVTCPPGMYVFHYNILSLSKSCLGPCAFFCIFKSTVLHCSSPTSPHGSTRIFLKVQVCAYCFQGWSSQKKTRCCINGQSEKNQRKKQEVWSWRYFFFFLLSGCAPDVELDQMKTQNLSRRTRR